MLRQSSTELMHRGSLPHLVAFGLFRFLYSIFRVAGKLVASYLRFRGSNQDNFDHPAECHARGAVQIVKMSTTPGKRSFLQQLCYGWEPFR